MKKKVGLITFHAAHNNGSFLQAFALQKYLSGIDDVDCEIINYQSYEQQELYAIWKKNNSLRNILKNVFTMMHRSLIKRRFHDFINIQKKLKQSQKEYHTLVELEELNNEYDCFMSGSDQIWNMDAWDYSDAYFLSFVNNKKQISYASSFGGFIKKIDAPKREKIKNYLKKYSFIGVRENIGKKMVEELTNKQAEVVVDPTLLLKEDDYEEICADRIVEEEYIFLYSIFAIKFDDSIMRTVQKISDKYDLPVYVLFTGNRTVKVTKYGCELLKVAAPNHFLSMIKYAKLVLTSSFHGTVFSIIYKKQFFLINPVKNGKTKKDDRMNTLLQNLGLEMRQISELDIDTMLEQKHINYEKIEGSLDSLILSSKQYLKRALRE